jgi:hypothetical protein
MDNSLYFPHDYTASDDVKLLYLRQAHDWYGIGLFWAIVERLAQSGGQLPLKFLPILAMQLQADEVKVSSIVKDFDLFEVTDTDFHSRRLMEHIELRKKFKESGINGAAKRWGNPKPPKIKLS